MVAPGQQLLLSPPGGAGLPGRARAQRLHCASAAPSSPGGVWGAAVAQFPSCSAPLTPRPLLLLLRQPA